MHAHDDMRALLLTAALVAAVVVPMCVTSPAFAADRPESQSSQPQQLQRSLVPRRSTAQRPAYQPVINDVERGIGSGSVTEFSAHFPSQLSISLRGEGSGTYSSIATGSASFTLKGGRETAQVYLSLSRSGDRWVISQINIY